MHGAEPLRHVASLHGRAAAVTSHCTHTTPRAAPPHFMHATTALHHARCLEETCDKTLARSNMADGSPENRTNPKRIDNLSFLAPEIGHGDTKKCSEDTLQDYKVNSSFYTEPKHSESCEKSVSSGVAKCCSAIDSMDSRKLCEPTSEDSEDRKRRCEDRYDSSESSDSGVAVLSPSDSSTCDSDITEPRSPGSPESGCSTGSEGRSSRRMPPWASESAPAPAPPPPSTPRRLPQIAPTRRSDHSHRRITEFFNHKMKPQNGVKRYSAPLVHDDIKRKCLPKNGVTHDLQKYISYLSQTLSPKVLLDVGKQVEAATRKSIPPGANCTQNRTADLGKNVPSANTNGMVDLNRPKDNNDKVHTTMNGFVEIRPSESVTKEKPLNRMTNSKKQGFNQKFKTDGWVTANGTTNMKKQVKDLNKTKVPISAKSDLHQMKILPSTEGSTLSKNTAVSRSATTKMNGIVSSSTAKLDSKMNAVTCGSNNLSLHSITCKPLQNKMAPKKNTTTTLKRTNRKSSACIANSRNLTWSKANNLKQVQLQQQNCGNTVQASPVNVIQPSVNGEVNTPQPKMNNIPNGIRQVSMTVNGLSNLNVPVTNFQNCHQLNIPQTCNGTVTSNNLPSFVAVPQNVMLTTLRIPQNGLQGQTLNTQNNMNAYTRQNCNVSSPTKLNGQFMFPLVQNLNGTVVQIPNLMAKMPNFVLPQTSQLTPQRQDHLQNQQAAQFLINGTLLKLANTMNSAFSNVNPNVKPTPTSQSIPVMNKNVTGIPAVGVAVQTKPNYTVNLSHSVLMPQPGFIVTSVPNMNVKETWSYTSTNMVSSSQTTCSNPIVQHTPPTLSNYQTQTLHTSSIPIAPAKPPDNPIQGTDPPSSTVKEPEVADVASSKCDIPWLSKTVNNYIVPLDCKLPSRPFANVSNLTDKFEEIEGKSKVRKEEKNEELLKESTPEEIRKVEEVARREETIFTQITVLKDVSSNVQNSVIEANFCSATMESSESGIGTDKSIDSPSDSHTSKECDDDSSLSLSVSVCSVDVQSCQKSPILKQPKTLRFPPRKLEKDSDQRTTSTDTTSTVTFCLWENCKQEFESDTDILEHLQSVHVESQSGKENYVCLWQQCKVRGKPSCSRLWLERHALSHGGNKPFKCIVDGCDRRFSTQIILERHVNNHFNDTASNTSGTKKTTDSATKHIRRNGKKLRYRRQPWSARMFDFFDAGMMEGLAWRLARATRWRLGGACPLREAGPSGGHHISFTACLAATRYNPATSAKEALLTYYPPNVIEDEWVPEKDVKRIKHVEISQLPAHSKVALYEQFCASYRKTPSPPPVKKSPPTPQPSRLLPARHCTSSRVLNNLLAKQRKERNNCSATNVPMLYVEEEKEKVEVSGAKKRKMGRRHGGNAFWPCGR